MSFDPLKTKSQSYDRQLGQLSELIKSEGIAGASKVIQRQLDPEAPLEVRDPAPEPSRKGALLGNLLLAVRTRLNRTKERAAQAEAVAEVNRAQQILAGELRSPYTWWAIGVLGQLTRGLKAFKGTELENLLPASYVQALKDRWRAGAQDIAGQARANLLGKASGEFDEFSPGTLDSHLTALADRFRSAPDASRDITLLASTARQLIAEGFDRAGAPRVQNLRDAHTLLGEVMKQRGQLSGNEAVIAHDARAFIRAVLDFESAYPGEPISSPKADAKRAFMTQGQGVVDEDSPRLGADALQKRLPIFILGNRIDRIAAVIRPPHALEGHLANVLGDLFANRGVVHSSKVDAYRTEAAVAAAVAAPKLLSGSPLGALTLYRPGLGNTPPGPAQIARLAQYTDKLIIAFANRGSAEEQKLRPLTEVDGVKLPPEIAGKVWAIGSPKSLMISYEQGSDLFLEQLAGLERAGIPLSGAGATVVAHSQGGLDTVLTRKRLEEAGAGNVLSRVVTLASPFRGSPLSDETMGGLFTGAIGFATDAQAMGALNALDPDHAAKHFGARAEKLVDLAMLGHMESGKDGRDNLRPAFKLTDKLIEANRLLPSLVSGGSDLRENDGLVTLASQKYGAKQAMLPKSYDHASIAEDPLVIDEILKNLGRIRS